MPVIAAPHEFNEAELFVDLESIFGHQLFLKCEGFNFAGSIKLKAATEMVEAAERDGVLSPRSILIESSSGNLGVALSMLAASKGYRFVCVTDARCNPSSLRLMEALGAEVHMIEKPADPGGFLGARIDYVRARTEADSRYVWLNQYANPGNWRAHFGTTAPSIASSVSRARRALRRRRHHRNADGMRQVFQAVEPSSQGRCDRCGRLVNVRHEGRATDDSGPRHQRAAGDAR